MKRDTDYEVDEKLKAISLTDTGITKAEKLLGVENIYTEKGIKYVHHLETAVKAQAIFERDKDYVVKEGEVVIVDLLPGVFSRAGAGPKVFTRRLRRKKA